MRSRNKLTQLLALFLALLTVVSVCPLSVSAESGFYEEGDANYDNTGGTSSDKSGEFNLSYTDNVAKQIVGYRITGIKANGEKQNPDSTDVYIKNAQYIKDMGQSAFKTKFEGSGIYVSMNQYCKREFYLAESSNSALADGTITAKSNYVYEWNYSLSDEIPTTEAEFDTWQKTGNNANQVAKWAGYSSKAAMKNGDKIIVEPIYYLNRVWSATCFLTVSEIANFGQSKYGGTSEGWINTGANEANKENNTTSGATTFGYIANFTNRKWPNAFYTKDGMGLWEGATAVGSSSRVTFNNMLLKGYGVIILYDEPTLPDLYVESIKFYTTDGQEQIASALPINKTIYVIATYKATTKNDVKANFFGGNLSGDRTERPLNVSSEMKVATGSISMSSTFGVRYGIYDNVTMTKYTSSTSSNRYEAPMYNGCTIKVRIGTLNSAYSTDCGYFHAAVYLNDKTSATTSDETNTTNNYKKVSYDFAGTLSRDLELGNIQLKLNGTTLSGDALKSIPFGATVDVYHTYKSNSKSDSSGMSEPYCVTLSGNSSNVQGMVMCQIDGAFVHEASSFYTTDKVGSFKATSLIDAERYGGIYLQSDHNYDAAEETNSDNNKKYVTWRAKCDIQVYQIILRDAAGNTLGTYTRGSTNSAPTLKQGQQVYVYYKYKNTSAGDIVANGHRSKSATSSNLTVSKVTIPANGTVTKYSHSFTVGSEQSGKVSGAVYVDKNKYGISSSSVTYTGCETNSTNNTLEMTYYVEDLIDLEIVKIQYKYTKNGASYTQTVNYADRNTKVVEIPYGVKVYVWHTYKNRSDKDLLIDGYYCHNATGNPGTLISDTRTDYNANGVTLISGATMTVCSGYFTASTLGTAYYYGAVFQDGKTDPTGEEDTANNTMTAKYKVVGYDVAITDIYFKDAAGTEYSKGNNSAEMDYGKDYKIYYTIKNNGTSPVYVNVYNDIEPGNGIGVCVTPAAQATAGIRLEVGQSRDVYVGDWNAADQTIGINPIGASVFLGTNTSATNFTYDGKTDTEINTANNVREEDVTLKFDVAITNIYFTTTDGGIQMKPDANGVIAVPANVELICYYVLKNNTAAAIDVNIYYEANGVVNSISDGPKIKVITLAAGEEKTVVAGRMGFTVSSSSSTTTKVIKGHVYRDGQEIKGDSYEKTFDNNIYEVTLNIYKTPYLTAIAPNASYRVGTDVITSFYLHNPTTTHYTGITANNALRVKFTVKSLSGDVLYTFTQNAIVPALCEGTTHPATYKHDSPGGAQLVFFKWSMPEEYTQSMVVVEAELCLPNGLVTTRLANNRRVCSNEVMNTPDTQYEAAPPSNWQALVNANAPFSSGNNSRSWYVYTYTGGRFVRNYYYYSASAKYVYMNPISATTEYNGSNFFMRSGYGVKLTAYGIDVSKNATASMYTDMQYAYATWQEFGYSTKEGKITTLEKVGSEWQLPEYMDYTNADGTGKRIHFTPIWYPNRDYSAYVCFSDIWTPMGMITAARETNEIQIRDDMYEDWYIGHG